MAFDLGDYKEVTERLADLFAAYPEASLRGTYEVVEVGDEAFISYRAECYRDDEDKAPGVGCAWEQVPGKTAYTKGSELQNAETSAWGRAIVAIGASTSKNVASADDVRNARARDEAQEPPDGYVRQRDGAHWSREHQQWMPADIPEVGTAPDSTPNALGSPREPVPAEGQDTASSPSAQSRVPVRGGYQGGALPDKLPPPPSTPGPTSSRVESAPGPGVRDSLPSGSSSDAPANSEAPGPPISMNQLGNLQSRVGALVAQKVPIADRRKKRGLPALNVHCKPAELEQWDEFLTEIEQTVPVPQ